MFTLSNRSKIHFYCLPVDGRWGFDRLAGICKQVLGLDPYNGDLFVFFNKNSDRSRMIYYDMSCSYLLSGRLEIGRFKISKLRDKKYLELRASDLLILLGGYELPENTKKPKRWSSKTSISLED